ncbi:alcohol dehydrogenase superfamily protein [Mycena haematopus]|nr:alcohol dehydrogenase superfamily protein [Mycena haematopus]
MTLPTTTRQYFYPQIGSFDNLVLQEVPVSSPKANEVLVKTHAISLQFRDLMIANGIYPEKLPENLVPGSDMAGEIIAVGAEVNEWKVGDRVCANFLQAKIHKDSPTAKGLGGPVHGVLTEYRTFPAEALVAIPEHLSYEEASTLPCAALTAYNALLSGFEPLKAGDTVLVQGTGGTSIFALQFSVASGATVIATSSSDEKLRVATKLGAKHVINYKTTPNWAAEVLKLTNGAGVDRVIEVGGNSTLKQSMEAVKRGGNIALIGALGGVGNVPAVDVIWPCIFKEINTRGVSIGSVIQFQNMNKLISANPETTRPVIDKVFGFDELKAGYAHLESQAHVGKVVIKIV